MVRKNSGIYWVLGPSWVLITYNMPTRKHLQPASFPIRVRNVFLDGGVDSNKLTLFMPTIKFSPLNACG